MDVTGLLAVRDEIIEFKKFLDNVGMQYPVFINIYSDNYDNKITFDITPIVQKTYKWVYCRLIAEIDEESDNSFPVLPHVGEELYKEYLSDQFGSERVMVKISYGTNVKYTKDITDWLFVAFERIGKYIKAELYNTHRDLFDSIKDVSNSLHTLKLF